MVNFGIFMLKVKTVIIVVIIPIELFYCSSLPFERRLFKNLCPTSVEVGTIPRLAVAWSYVPILVQVTFLYLKCSTIMYHGLTLCITDKGNINGTRLNVMLMHWSINGMPLPAGWLILSQSQIGIQISLSQFCELHQSWVQTVISKTACLSISRKVVTLKFDLKVLF